MTDAGDVRSSLVAALHADLVGPFDPEAARGEGAERLTIPPSRWKLTGTPPISLRSVARHAPTRSPD